MECCILTEKMNFWILMEYRKKNVFLGTQIKRDFFSQSKIFWWGNANFSIFSIHHLRHFDWIFRIRNTDAWIYTEYYPYARFFIYTISSYIMFLDGIRTRYLSSACIHVPHAYDSGETHRARDSKQIPEHTGSHIRYTYRISVLLLEQNIWYACIYVRKCV